MIEKDQPDGGSRKDHRQQGKKGAEDTFSRVVAVSGGRIHPGIAMMDQVEFPHPFYLVLQPVDQPGADEIQQYKPCQAEQPTGEGNDPEQPDLMLRAVMTGANDKGGECEIDQDGRKREKEI